MAKEVKMHIGILLATVLACFIWVNIPELNRFSLQLSAMLLLILLISHRFQTPHSFKLTQSIISTIAVIFITTSTGTLASPLFFINTLLLFELSILLEPIIPIVLAFALILFYFYPGNSQGSVFSYAVLFSLPLITPLAYFLGKLYQKVKNQKKEIKNLSHKVEELQEELIEEEVIR